jgi:hypothetical protein
MLGLVFGIMGIIGFVVYRTIWREERERLRREASAAGASDRGANPGR